MYYEKRVEQLNSNVKRTWSLLNDIVNRKWRSRHEVSSFHEDSQGVSNPIQKLTCLKNIGPNLAEKISNPQEVLLIISSGEHVKFYTFRGFYEHDVLDIWNWNLFWGSSGLCLNDNSKTNYWSNDFSADKHNQIMTYS